MWYYTMKKNNIVYNWIKNITHYGKRKKKLDILYYETNILIDTNAEKIKWYVC